MKQSDIRISVFLDENRVPDKIMWDASDKPEDVNPETKSFSLSIWDHVRQGSLRMDLWTKDMPVLEMKRFYIESIAGMAECLLNATNDELMVKDIKDLCVVLSDRLIEEEKKGGL